MLAQFFGSIFWVWRSPRCIGMKLWAVSGVIYFHICVTGMMLMEWHSGVCGTHSIQFGHKKLIFVMCWFPNPVVNLVVDTCH